VETTPECSTSRDKRYVNPAKQRIDPVFAVESHCHMPAYSLKVALSAGLVLGIIVNLKLASNVVRWS
jgi:hypothetical protein